MHTFVFVFNVLWVANWCSNSKAIRVDATNTTSVIRNHQRQIIAIGYDMNSISWPYAFRPNSSWDSASIARIEYRKPSRHCIGITRKAMNATTIPAAINSQNSLLNIPHSESAIFRSPFIQYLTEPLYDTLKSAGAGVPKAHGVFSKTTSGLYTLHYHANYPYGVAQLQTQLVTLSSLVYSPSNSLTYHN